MSNQRHGGHAFTGVFLVGLGIIAIFDWWWPGIMFVLAVSFLVQALLDGRLADNIISILILAAIGLAGVWQKMHFHPGFSIWPVLFIAIGLGYLVKTFWKRS
jgi:hypothetical protein